MDRCNFTFHTNHDPEGWPVFSPEKIKLGIQIVNGLMDKCQTERNPISRAVVKALADAHLKCCMQMYNVRTLVQSVEESNGTEAWRRALMWKIMSPAELCFDHFEIFESSLKAQALDVGEWERASGVRCQTQSIKYKVMGGGAHMRQQCRFWNNFVVALVNQA